MAAILSMQYLTAESEIRDYAKNEGVFSSITPQ